MGYRFAIIGYLVVMLNDAKLRAAKPKEKPYADSEVIAVGIPI
jgi:hypothetical protein